MKTKFAERSSVQASNEILFIKNMAHHLELMDQSFVEQVTNVFLIRNPRQILASYSQVIEAPTLRDIGIEYQFILFERLKKDGTVTHCYGLGSDSAKILNRY